MTKIFSIQKAIIFLIVLTFSSTLCIAQDKELNEKPAKNNSNKVTFVELGSVNCIPCKKMQPIMDSIEKKYEDQIKVIFYDVWKTDQKKYAKEYGISLIPTQVFLDKEGKEFHRHQGFYPEAEIDKILKSKGLIPNTEL